MQGCGTLWGYFLIKGLLTGSILQGFIRTFWCCDTSLPTARLQAVHEDWVVDCSESLHTNIRFVLSSTFVKTDVSASIPGRDPGSHTALSWNLKPMFKQSDYVTFPQECKPDLAL